MVLVGEDLGFADTFADVSTRLDGGRVAIT